MIATLYSLAISIQNYILSIIDNIPLSAILWFLGVVVIPFVCWIYLWRPIIIVDDKGAIKFGEDILGSTFANSSYDFIIKNIGKRSARISNLEIIGYHDSGEDIEIIKKGEIQLRYFTSENLKFSNPIPPGKPLKMHIKLDFIGASANRILIMLGYKDSDIKIYCKRKKFYYTINDGNVEEILDTNLKRLKQIIEVDEKISSQS